MDVSEIIIWREKERSRIRAVKMDKLRGLLGIRRIDNARIRELCRVTKELMKMFSYVWSCGKNKR